MAEQPNGLPAYTPKDFTSDQDVRWCPGCGDYAVLTAVRKALPGIGARKEDYVFVSGIGCAARFPYYMDTYGVHSIHGRALSVATGIKIANPRLKVIVVCGDGDLLSIGGNHTLHTMRRNVDLTIVLLNNRIYGLTKGQYSPTSELGKVTKSSPMGSPDMPVGALSLAAGAGCAFFGRCLDIDAKMLIPMLQRAVDYPGTAFIEVYQDCNIFNHQAWFYASQKDSRADHTIELVHGRPMIFGKDRDRGVRLRPDGKPEIVRLGNGVSEGDLLVHDETDRNLAFMLAQFQHPHFPEPLGVFYAAPPMPTYDGIVHEQTERARAQPGQPDLASLIRGRETWEVT